MLDFKVLAIGVRPSRGTEMGTKEKGIGGNVKKYTQEFTVFSSVIST